MAPEVTFIAATRCLKGTSTAQIEGYANSGTTRECFRLLVAHTRSEALPERPDFFGSECHAAVEGLCEKLAPQFTVDASLEEYCRILKHANTATDGHRSKREAVQTVLHLVCSVSDRR